MKTLKITAKIAGVLWMIVFGLAFVFNLSKQSFDFSTSYGLGYFLGMCAAMIFIASIGYFLFRWGRR